MPHRYLIVQLADLGDLILSTPAINALRDAERDAHIAILTPQHTPIILQDTGLVDEVITFERRALTSSTALFRPKNLRRILGLHAKHYDTIIFFHHFTIKLGTLKFALIAAATGAKRVVGLDNGNGWFLTHRLKDNGFGAKHQAQYWLNLVGMLGASSARQPAIVSVQPQKAGIWQPETGTPIRVIIHPGSGGYSLARRWPAEKFAAVADALVQEYNVEIVLVGGKNDNTADVKAAMKSQATDLTGQTSLPELAYLLERADLFIGAESGIMHLAAAMSTPLVTIFGPGNPDAWGPWNPDGLYRVVRSAPECSPCSYVGHGIGLREGCAARTCLRMVDVEHVLQAARDTLNGIPMLTAEKSAPSPIFPRRIRMLGLPVDGITYTEWLELIQEWISQHSTLNTQHSGLETGDWRLATIRHVCTINPEFMMIAQSDPNFNNILNRAALCVPDGVGLLWAAKRRGTPLPERVTGSDGVPIIAERAAQKGWKLFFLGAAPGIAQKAADILQERCPGLQIVGVYSGSPAPDEEDALVEIVNASGADILFVAYGAPEQDKWIARNTPRLKVAMAMGVGGSFDFIAGAVPRAPLWMRRLGIEWLYRLYLQPWRIRRMMRLPRFVLAVLLERG